VPPRTLACQPRAVERAAPGTAKATANPKPNKLQRQLPQRYHPSSPYVNRNRTKQTVTSRERARHPLSRSAPSLVYSDMNLQRRIGYIWVCATIVFFGSFMWQAYPVVASNQLLGQKALLRLELDVFLKPWNLITWIVLVVYGIASGWIARGNWRQDRGAMYVFLMCSFSVVWFFVILLIMR
jgi:hypothetical protein